MLNRPWQRPVHLAALSFGLAALASACERPPAASVSAPLPIPTVHAQEAARSGIELTHPSQAAAAWVEELGYLEQLVGLWWAARDEHRKIDGTDVHAVFERAREKTGACTKLACYAGVLRETLCALGDGHLTVQPEWWLPRKRFESGIRLVATKDRVVVAAPPPEGLSAGDVLVTIAGASTDDALRAICERPGSTPAQRRRNAVESLAATSRFDDTEPPPRELGFNGAAGEKKAWTLRWHPALVADGRPPAPCVSGRVVNRARSIAYLHVATFWCDGDAGRFDKELRAAADATAGAKRLVVDLRDNGGGMDGPAQQLAAALARDKIEWMRFRHPRPYPDESPPTPTFFRSYVEPSDKLAQWKKADLWFLIGPGCFSTCDTFASALRLLQNTHFVGETTAGGVGNPTPFRLPYSGIVVNIPVTLYAAPGRADDVLIEAHGTEPGAIVTASADDVRLARDPVLDAALAK